VLFRSHAADEEVPIENLAAAAAIYEETAAMFAAANTSG